MRKGRLVLVVAGVVCLISATGLAQKAEAPDAVCVAKTDRTGGRLGFVVLERDAATFEREGFYRLACPAGIAARAPALVARCRRLESQTATGRRVIEDLYGLSLAEMCGATRAWARSIEGGGE